MTLKPQRVREFMATDVMTVTPDTDIMRAVHLLVAKDVSGVPVVDADGRVLGILTERDCIDVALQAGYHDDPGGNVERYMTTPVRTVTPDSSLMDLAEVFASSSFRRCPVVEGDRLVGMIGRRDVLRALAGGSWFSFRRR